MTAKKAKIVLGSSLRAMRPHNTLFFERKTKTQNKKNDTPMISKAALSKMDPSPQGEDDLESVNSETSTSEGNQSSQSNSLAKKETRMVHFLRALVLVVLVTAAAGVAYAVNRYTKNEQDSEFKEQFEATTMTQGSGDFTCHNGFLPAPGCQGETQ